MAWHAKRLALAIEGGTARPPPKPRRRRGRPPIHLSASLNLVLPCQLFPQFPADTSRSGEKRLMLAVLQDAIDVLMKHAQATEPRDRHLYLETVEWIRSDDSEWPFSFVNACDALGLSVSCLRRGLGRLLPRHR
jgi:hypothetical protein